MINTQIEISKVGIKCFILNINYFNKKENKKTYRIHSFRKNYSNVIMTIIFLLYLYKVRAKYEQKKIKIFIIPLYCSRKIA